MISIMRHTTSQIPTCSHFGLLASHCFHVFWEVGRIFPRLFTHVKGENSRAHVLYIILPSSRIIKKNKEISKLQDGTLGNDVGIWEYPA